MSQPICVEIITKMVDCTVCIRRPQILSLGHQVTKCGGGGDWAAHIHTDAHKVIVKYSGYKTNPGNTRYIGEKFILDWMLVPLRVRVRRQ